MKKCRKQGHKSREAAEAHVRALQKAIESGVLVDEKDGQEIHVYLCDRWLRECKAKPYHVGHRRKSEQRV